ncbi:tyrosinase family protein [Massilia sp. 9I]|uniref:tyrosinase family protein n=1 Tax=Massilia sp. 9I TaxID=2653152 RepID=UPI0012F3E9AA|nr:tyrosinase family protein [Massilia sp. 9I]VXB87684.1 conserved exported hypothetical protein [Massilia sp. 9I]
MEPKHAYRRTLLKTALGVAVAQCFPGSALAQSGYRTRLEWQHFKKTSQYKSFLSAIAAMRANTNQADRNSLRYWANVHVNYCPHGTPYFIAWHRGYLHFFERQLQILSGDPLLNIPYWDYYSYATMPAEFTDPSPGNPLYLQRMSANVRNALSLSPFAPTVYNFQRGTWNAFEPKLENVHNPVHDLIGGIMATMQSPLDPIFYLHHANVDRLTHAWALPDGKGIPLSAFPYSPSNSDPYWAGMHVYATDLSLDRFLTLIPTWLGNDYEGNSVPSALPPIASATQSATTRLAANTAEPDQQRPPFRAISPSPGREISPTRRSLGGAIELSLDEGSASIELSLSKRDASELARAVTLRKNELRTRNPSKAGAVKLVVDKPIVSDAGSRGGYFYALYLNMPPSVGTPAVRTQTYVGTLGAFQIAAASHHGPASLEYDVSDLLAQQAITDFSGLSLSWVRVDGNNPPIGRTIQVGEIRTELSYEVEQAEPPPLPKPPGWYGRPPRPEKR